ncbi:PilW family protein [Effusibacillus pohliae]|uniref:PilW family protein n=1 Tax=Effusibacillus pohliae TaxID=232270 RepID=UPI0003723ED4|nr:prepilin-type N-terminal cleavage/methylation domain-containing protein [Effusibacillus pohliae]
MPNREKGLTLLETLASLTISLMLLGILFTLVLSLLKQQNGTTNYNAAKQTVLLISDTLSAKVKEATVVNADWTAASFNFQLDTGNVFTMTQNAADPSLWDVVVQDTSGNRVALGSVGFCWENRPQVSPANSLNHLVFTFWQTYVDDTGKTQRYILTAGYHTSVVH